MNEPLPTTDEPVVARSAGGPRIAVLLPCYNEALTIGKVVRDFRAALPEAVIYVYDNNSKDDTARIAREAGAVVRREKRQGKGFVVQRMFDEIDADIYLMADGDDTYPADRARDLIAPLLEEKADMVVGNRLVQYGQGSFRPLHVFGNRLVRACVNLVFGSKLADIMSGYRAMTREMVKRVPIRSAGFEVETELTLQTLYRDFVITEVDCLYGERPEGSFSKLRTFHDGARVLIKIVDIFKAYRPLAFFSVLALLFGLAGVAVGLRPILDMVQMGRNEHVGLAVLAAALEIIAIVTASCGVILDGVNQRFRELALVVYKADPQPGRAPTEPPR